MSIVKVTEKGQITLPVALRRNLKIGNGDYLMVEMEENVLTLRKVRKTKLLGSDDPIWDFVGRASTGSEHGSTEHHHYIAEGERKRWRKC